VPSWPLAAGRRSLSAGLRRGGPGLPPLSAEQAPALLQEPLPPEAELPAWLQGLEELVRSAAALQ
jgi:hypothetical protein